MEWLVEKAVEIGMKKMIFLHCKNSERSKISLDKLKKVAIAAMKQSHGSWLPDFEVYNFSEALEIYGGGAFIAHCEIGAKEELSSLKRDSVVFIGPEGDFASDEIELARVKGLKELNLGSRILRTETAGLAACLSANLLG
jgi:16S rRNA (uracil1498-N3)-methyltransferase